MRTTSSSLGRTRSSPARGHCAQVETLEAEPQRTAAVVHVRRTTITGHGRWPTPQRDTGHRVTGASGGDQITTGSLSDWGHKVLRVSVGDGRDGVGNGDCALGALTGVGDEIGKDSLTSCARHPRLATSATSPAPTKVSNHRGVGRIDPICSCSGSPTRSVSDLLLCPSADCRPRCRCAVKPSVTGTVAARGLACGAR